VHLIKVISVIFHHAGAKLHLVLQKKDGSQKNGALKRTLAPEQRKNRYFEPA
jgi:predicted cupin superfamily sugar epimerase